MVALRSFISKLRSSLSYGNVMATVAVFLALSGTGAYAAKKLKFKLPVNSVLSSHIRDGQVGTADLADGAVGGSKIAAGAVDNSKIAPGAVTGAKVLDGSLTGLDMGPDSLGPDEIDESSLGIVPSASTATTAETANALGNIEARTIQFRKNDGDGADVQVLNLGGLVLTANCASGGTEAMTITATTTKNNSALFASVPSQSGITNVLDRNFTTADSAVISGPTPSASADDSAGFQGTLTYMSSEQPPSVVSLTYGGAEDALAGRATACIFNGTALHHLGI